MFLTDTEFDMITAVCLKIKGSCQTETPLATLTIFRGVYAFFAQNALLAGLLPKGWGVPLKLNYLACTIEVHDNFSWQRLLPP